jgi:hypothetical protein
MLFLIPNQKPQLMPALALAIAFLLMRLPKDTQRPRHIWLAMACITIAAGCKYSFYLQAGILFIAAMLTSFPPRTTAIAFVLCSIVFIVPQQLRTFVFYGDPLSPFLEGLMPRPDSAVTAFASFLRNVAGTPSPDRYLTFIVELFFPPSLGGISVTLGLGFLGFAAALVSRSTRRVMLTPAIAFAASLVLTQLSPRFFLDVYLWTGIVLVTSAALPLQRMLVHVIGLQLLVVLAGAVYGAISLFPGAWSAQHRHKVMMQCAVGYDASEWIDRSLPADVLLLYRIRSAALAPRHAFVFLEYHEKESSPWIYINSQLEVHKRPVFIILGKTDDAAAIEALVGPLSAPLGPPFQSQISTRNPFNREPGQIYTLHQIQKFRSESTAQPALPP